MMQHPGDERHWGPPDRGRVFLFHGPSSPSQEPGRRIRSNANQSGRGSLDHKIDTALKHPYSIPVVAVAGHRPIAGGTNVLLDHRFAAELTLSHLYSLGHRDIAFMRGQPFSSDSDERSALAASGARDQNQD